MMIETVSGPRSGCWPSALNQSGIAADRAVLDEDAREAAEADQAGQRHRQRRQADMAIQKPLNSPRQRPTSKRGQDRQPDRHAHARRARP